MAKLTKEQKERAIELLSDGLGPLKTCRELGVTHKEYFETISEDSIFEMAVARAQSIGFDVMADSLLEMNEHYGDVQRARLQSDNIKFILAKRKPQVYGDRIDINMTQTIDISAARAEALRRALPLRDSTNPQSIETRDVIEVQALESSDTPSVDPIENDPSKIPSGSIFD